MSQLTQEGFRNFFKYYNGEEHQIRAVDQLFMDIPPEIKQDDALWVTMYRETPEKPDAPKIINPLDVPYQSQNDNKSGTGYRECFSSSCAMVAMYYGKVDNDDHYNDIRANFGDSTDAQAQVRTLRKLGLEANFITNATVADLKHQIDIGRPTPCGWLHNGTVYSPSGGGHYSVVTGYGKDYWVQNDPNGEAQLTGGGYVNHTGGESVHYSFKNWNPRWIVEGDGTGWMMDIYDPKK